MPYRDATGPTEETLDSFQILTSGGANWTGILAGLSLVAAVAWLTSIITEVPAEIVPWVWTFPTLTFAFAAPALALWHRRKRELRILRIGGRIRLVIPGESELTFPLALSGTQLTMSMRGVPIHEAYLKAVDPNGEGLLLHETRGAAHGALPDWFSALDKASPARAYDVRRVGDLPRLRARIEEINRKDPRDVT